MEGDDGSDGGLAPLASAVEKATAGVGAQDLALNGVGMEGERLAREANRVKEVEGIHCSMSIPFNASTTAVCASGNWRNVESRTEQYRGQEVGKPLRVEDVREHSVTRAGQKADGWRENRT